MVNDQYDEEAVLELFTFRAKDEILGIDAQYVYRVIDDAKATPVPFTPECHLGLMYYRGELFDVIDIGSLLGLTDADQKKDPRVILIKWSNKKLGLISDQVEGLVWEKEKEENDISPAKPPSGARAITPEHIWDLLLKLPYGH